MKKIVFVAAFVLITASLFGCTKNNTKPTASTAPEATQTTHAVQATAKPKKTDIDISELGNKLNELISSDDPLPLEKDAIADDLYLEESDIADCFGAITFTGSFPGKIIIIKAIDGDALERINAKLNEKLDDVLVQSKDYDAENYALAQTCKVITEGNYTALFIHARHAEMEKLFEESFN